MAKCAGEVLAPRNRFARRAEGFLRQDRPGSEGFFDQPGTVEQWYDVARRLHVDRDVVGEGGASRDDAHLLFDLGVFVIAVRRLATGGQRRASEQGPARFAGVSPSLSHAQDSAFREMRGRIHGWLRYRL